MERRVFGIMKDRPLFALLGDFLLKRSKTQYGILNSVILGDSNTKYINFGEGNGSLGYGVPGKRVEAMKVGHIDPLACAGYSNVIIHCGLNDLKGNQPQPNAVFDQLLSTTQAIRLVCPRARI